MSLKDVPVRARLWALEKAPLFAVLFLCPRAPFYSLRGVPLKLPELAVLEVLESRHQATGRGGTLRSQSRGAGKAARGMGAA